MECFFLTQRSLPFLLEKFQMLMNVQLHSLLVCPSDLLL